MGAGWPALQKWAGKDKVIKDLGKYGVALMAVYNGDLGARMTDPNFMVPPTPTQHQSFRLDKQIKIIMMI